MRFDFFQKLTASCFTFVALFCGVFPSIPSAEAAGTFITNDYMQAAPTALSAAVFHDGKRETLLASWTFDFNPLLAGDFYWIIPVPSKPDVENISSDFFAQIEKLSDPAVSPETLKTRGVVLLGNKVFEPQYGSKKLETWFSDAGYFIPKRLEPVLGEYMQKGWYIVAVQVNGLHIQRDASESLTIDTAHTMPVKISFDTDAAIVPLKFASIPPDIDAPGATLFYGVSSSQFLGAKDEQIDALLAKPSLNRFPRLPLESSNIKVDLFIFGKGVAQVPGFTALKQTTIDGGKFEKGSWNASSLDLPAERLTLTHLEDYSHLEDLADLTIKDTMSTLETPLASVGILFPSVKFSVLFLFGILFSFVAGIFLGEKLKLGVFFRKYVLGTETVRSESKKIIAITFFVFLVIGFGLLGVEKKGAVSDSQIGGSDNFAGAAMPGMNLSSGVNGREISMKSGDFFFTPSTLTLKAGERVVLHIDSVGRHTFTVKELGINVETPAGAITDVAFTPTKKGIFEMYCDVAGHREGGQTGTLVVE